MKLLNLRNWEIIDAWFDGLFWRGKNETDLEYWKHRRNGVKGKLVKSFRNGQNPWLLEWSSRLATGTFVPADWLSLATDR
jgi:hypothetical protein